jgi:RNA polymerase sigma factor (sigma-70 family)
MGICRRIQRNEADVDDAFQATFFVLVRRAASIRRPRSLGSWLHGVALRLARRSLANADRRRRHELAASVSEADENKYPEPGLRGILDEELDRLSEKHRAPLVLCYLEGKTIAEAARQLGWAHGTVCGRLARGRNQLRSRLLRRGLAPTIATVALDSVDTIAAVPPSLSVATIRFAALISSTETAATVGISSGIAELMDGAMKAMFLNKMKTTVAVLIGISVLTTGAAAWAFVARRDMSTEDSPPQKPEAGYVSSSRLDVHGDPLPNEALARLGTVRLRHGGFIGFVHFSDGGKRLISQGIDGVRVWETTTGKELYELPKETSAHGSWHGAALSNDGKLLATASSSGAYIWNSADGTLLRSRADGNYGQIEFAPDGETLLLSRSDEQQQAQVILADAKTCQPIWTVDVGSPSSLYTTFGNLGKTVVIGSTGRREQTHTLQILDARTGREQQEIDLGSSGPNKMTASPDGSLIAVICRQRGSGDFDDHVRLWEIPSGKERFRINSPPERDETRQKIFSALIFTRDGRSLITAGGSDELVFWDTESGNEQKRLGTDMTAARDLDLSPDGKTLAVAGQTALRIVDLANGADIMRGPEPYSMNYAMFSKDGRTAITGNSRMIVFWDAMTGREQRRDSWTQRSSVDYLSGISSDGAVAYRTNHADKALYIRNVATGQETGPIPLEAAGKWGPWLAAISPDGKVLAFVDNQHAKIQLRDGATGKLLKEIEDGGLQVRHLHFTADSQTLVACCADRTVRIWNSATGAKLRQLGPLGGARPRPGVAIGRGGIDYRTAISRDGKLLASGSSERSLVLYDTLTGTEIRRSEPLAEDLDELVFSPDGRMIACASRRAPAIQLIEVATCKVRHTLPGHRGPVSGLNFSEDCRKLISWGDDTTALVWDLTGKLDVTRWGQPPDASHLAEFWERLASDDAATAYQAIRTLAGTPAISIPYIRERLSPVTASAEASATSLTNPFIRGMRAVEVLELAGTADARASLKSLAGGASAAQLTLAARAALARFQGESP